MVLPPLADWDEAVLRQVAPPEENNALEKKGCDVFNLATDLGKRVATEELAKQVCAFSNSGPGFFVVGINKSGKLDEGVYGLVGRTPVKDWVEQLIPKVTEPPVDRCEARHIRVDSHHKPEFGVVVVHIPLSVSRPHWVRGNQEVAYIRAGSHSLPMSNRTLLDISSRTDSPSGRVVELGVEGGPGTGSGATLPFSFDLRPQVELLTGPVCQNWAVEVSVEPGKGEFRLLARMNARFGDKNSSVCLTGDGPLFPRQKVRIPSEPLAPLRLHTGASDENCPLTVTLFAGSALPVSKTFPLRKGV